MTRHIAFSIALLLAAPAIPAEAAREAAEFEELTMIFELNETDGDAEVVISVQTSEGMDRLTVFDPRGDKRIDLTAKGRRDVGHGEVLIESAEPSIEAVKRAFPEGRYTFVARTISGQHVVGMVTLSHDLLPAPDFSPSGEEGLDPDHVVVTWTPVPGAAAYQIEVEQDEVGANLTVTVGPDVSSLQIPAGFLQPGTEYEIGVAAFTSDGNLAVAESSFTTGN